MYTTHHVPGEGSEPVEGATNTTDVLQPLLLVYAFMNGVDYKGRWDEAEGHQHYQGYACICYTLLPVNGQLFMRDGHHNIYLLKDTPYHTYIADNNF